MLHWRAMAFAVSMLSPVTMRTKMPAFWQSATAPGTSGRTGSWKPSRPIIVSLSSTAGQSPTPFCSSVAYCTMASQSCAASKSR